jgi:hypothetical protein
MRQRAPSGVIRLGKLSVEKGWWDSMRFRIVAGLIGASVAAAAVWILGLPPRTLAVAPFVLVACAAAAARDRYLGRRPSS